MNIEDDVRAVSGDRLKHMAESVDAVGEESVGGTASTPDQNVVEELAVSTGIEIPDGQFLQTKVLLEQRDDHRWELDPDSAEDYDDYAS